MNLTYSEQRMWAVFERLSDLYSSEKDKRDFFVVKAWESCWHRMEFTDWLERIKRG